MTRAQNIARRLHSAGYDWRNAVRIAFSSHAIFENDLLTAAESADPPITFKGQPKAQAESNPKAKAQAVKDLQ